MATFYGEDRQPIEISFVSGSFAPNQFPVGNPNTLIDHIIELLKPVDPADSLVHYPTIWPLAY